MVKVAFLKYSVMLVPLFFSLPLVGAPPGYVFPGYDPLDEFISEWRAEPDIVERRLQAYANDQAEIIAAALYREVVGYSKPIPPKKMSKFCSMCSRGTRVSEPVPPVEISSAPVSFSPSKFIGQYIKGEERAAFFRETERVGRIVRALHSFDRRETSKPYASFFSAALTRHLTDVPPELPPLLLTRLSEARSEGEEEFSAAPENSPARKKLMKHVIKNAGLDLILGALGAPVMPEVSPAESFVYLGNMEALLVSAFKELHGNVHYVGRLTSAEYSLNNVDLELARVFFLSAVKSKEEDLQTLAKSAMRRLSDVEWVDMSSAIAELKEEFGGFVKEEDLAETLQYRRWGDYGRFLHLNNIERVKEETRRLQSKLFQALQSPSALSSPESVLGLMLDQNDLWNLIHDCSELPSNLLKPVVSLDEAEALVSSVWDFLDPLQKAGVTSWISKANSRRYMRCGQVFYVGNASQRNNKELEFASHSFKLHDDAFVAFSSTASRSSSRVPRLDVSAASVSDDIPYPPSRRSNVASSNGLSLLRSGMSEWRAEGSSPPARAASIPKLNSVPAHPSLRASLSSNTVGASQGVLLPSQALGRVPCHESSPSCGGDIFGTQIYSASV